MSPPCPAAPASAGPGSAGGRPAPRSTGGRAGPGSTGGRPTGVRDALLAAALVELAESGPGGISLRAIARRAGVSHAAPKHHFGDRAGLLTALAVDGFRALGTALRSAEGRPERDRRGEWAALGRAYISCALATPQVFALMFRPELLRRDDPDLVLAQRQAFAPLAALAAAGTAPPEPPGTPDLALLAWSFAHGVAMLAADGALQRAAGADDGDTEALITRLTDQFAGRLVG